MGTVTKAISTYPHRIVTLRVYDAGPVDLGGGRCPHCGAEGRWIYSFLCDDGKVHAAMSGCIKLFPESRDFPTLRKMAKLAIEKDMDMRLHPATRGTKLAGWFQATLDTLARLEKGEVTLLEAANLIAQQHELRRDWLERKGFIRSYRR